MKGHKITIAFIYAASLNETIAIQFNVAHNSIIDILNRPLMLFALNVILNYLKYHQIFYIP